MAKGNDRIFYETILKDVLKKQNEAIKEVVDEITFEIQKSYDTAIDAFYADYPNPRRYDRTYSTYEASSASKWSFTKDNKYVGGIWGSQNISLNSPNKMLREYTQDAYQAGIIVDPANISGKPYRSPTDWVFERTYVKGIHGINVKKKGRTFQLKYKAKDESERNLSFTAQMQNMHPTPKRLMDISFQKLSSRKAIRRRIDEAFKRQYGIA